VVSNTNKSYGHNITVKNGAKDYNPKLLDNLIPNDITDINKHWIKMPIFASTQKDHTLSQIVGHHCVNSNYLWKRKRQLDNAMLYLYELLFSLWI
jgi:hypothetical protein